jgi:protein-S-isoprenylcysteine O-methyltransferase Ste14
MVRREEAMDLARVWVVLLWVWIASEAVLQIVTRTSRRDGTVMDRGSLPILLVTIYCSIWIAMSSGAAPAYRLPGGVRVLVPAAILLMVIGLAVRWTAILTLGLSFSTNVAIHGSQTLRVTGIFRYLRHPSYSGMLLIFAAVGLSRQNWISLAIMLVFPTGALLYRIHVEEAALRTGFGDEYVEYCRATNRLIPGVY